MYGIRKIKYLLNYDIQGCVKNLINRSRYIFNILNKMEATIQIGRKK